MTDSPRAVFLSYASQDVAAVARICEALRAAGAEVWFDRSELLGGDAWDAKIRKQIRECALFVPVISANTQARLEGYFRREWRLAVERMHDMDDGQPFLLPVVIDDTADADARVPERFRERQWTRLPGGATPPEFAGRIGRMLAGEAAISVATSILPPRAGLPGGGRARAPLVPPRGTRARRLAPVGLAIVAIGAAVVWRSSRTRASSPSAVPGDAVSAAAPAAPLLAKIRMLYNKVGFTRDDLAVAEDLARRSTEADPGSAEAWGARAGVQAAYVFRNWDVSEQRRRDAQSFANRALALNPNEAEAQLALGHLLSYQGASNQAELVLRQALALSPGDNRLRRALGIAIEQQGPARFMEGRAQLQEAVRRDPRDVLARYDLAQSFSPDWGIAADPAATRAAMIEQLDAALAVRPFGSALVLEALVQAGAGNLPAMRAALDRLAPEDRTEDRAVAVLMWCGLLEHRPERVEEAARLTARDYFEDSLVAGPKDWYLALARRQAGQEGQARLEWEAAERVMRLRVAAQPASTPEQLRLAVTLAWLGKSDEAARLAAPIDAAWKEESDPDPRMGHVLGYYYAGLGDAGNTVRCLRPALDKIFSVTSGSLAFDPWWDKLRGQPAFDAFLVSIHAPPAPARGSSRSAVRPDASVPAVAAAAPAAEPGDPLLRRAKQLIDSNDSVVADLGVAEDLVKEVLAARPADAEATVLMGRIETFYLQRGFDRSEARFALARQYSERALALAPGEPEAMADLAGYLFRRGTELPRAAALARQAIALRPGEVRYRRLLGEILSESPGVTDAEVIASALQTAELFPRDALAQYDLARHYRDAGELDETIRRLDLAIELGSVPNALITKAELMLSLNGDLTLLQRLPEQLPDRFRGTDRAIFNQFVYALASGQYEVGLEALRASSEPWMIDFDYTGPTSLPIGELLLQQGKTELARLKFEEARAEMTRHPTVTERNFSTIWLDGWILMRLGRLEEARARNAVVFPELRRPFRMFLGTNWWFSPIPGNLLMGERAKALALMREAVDFQYGRQIIREALRHDPRMTPWRDDREITELLAGPEARPAPAIP